MFFEISYIHVCFSMHIFFYAFFFFHKTYLTKYVEAVVTMLVQLFHNKASPVNKLRGINQTAEGDKKSCRSRVLERGVDKNSHVAFPPSL